MRTAQIRAPRHPLLHLTGMAKSSSTLRVAMDAAAEHQQTQRITTRVAHVRVLVVCYVLARMPNKQSGQTEVEGVKSWHAQET
jgi:hypothetical protein